MIFTEGTILTNKTWVGLPREEIVKHVRSWTSLSREELEKLQKTGAAPGIGYFEGSVPIGNCVSKIETWKRQGPTIVYLTSRRTSEEIETIRNVLRKFSFPDGELLFRRASEEYKDVAKRTLPDIIVEDGCESIGVKKK